MTNQDLKNYYNSIAPKRDKYKKRNNFYHKQLEKYFGFIIPKDSLVLEIGCSTGDLLNAVKPKKGIGIDFSQNAIDIAKKKYPHLQFILADCQQEFNIDFVPQYVIISDLLTSLFDIQQFFSMLKKVCDHKSKIIISSYNYLWEPILKIGEFFSLKEKPPLQNSLTIKDIQNLLYLEDFEIISKDKKILLPKYIPFFNLVFNKFLANMPFFRKFDLINLITAKKINHQNQDYSVSIIVPARNEKGNIENAILRTPKFGSHQEFIFVEGNSQDNTFDECIRIKEKYQDIDIKVFKQSGKGKGNAVREAFDMAKGEILMILDADLTTPPEDLPKFYDALKTGKCEFVNGCRLVYQMEKEAMRFLNFLANKFFGALFSYLLGQKLKDTLCGTKVLFRSDYQKIKENRSFFGDFDPFGDFDLLFGASKLNLKIREIIVRYKDREYGSTQISRFKHGWLLIKMSIFAMKKIKFF